MFRFRKPAIENFRADYAKRADFCEIFEKDMKRLYLLAFLLTADHKQAEHCFASTVEEAFISKKRQCLRNGHDPG
jgi:hypothetical protein